MPTRDETYSVAPRMSRWMFLKLEEFRWRSHSVQWKGLRIYLEQERGLLQQEILILMLFLPPLSS